MLKSWTGPAVLATGFVIVSCAFGQELHLKTRTIQTPAQATATLPSLRQSGGNLQTTHQVVEFDHPAGAADINELMLAGAQITGILPDNAVMISIPGGLQTLPFGVIWVGPVDAQDKISPMVVASVASAATADNQTPVIVEFHSDVAADNQNTVQTSLGMSFLRPSGMLPQHVIVQAAPADLAALAARDEVAYIFPADAGMLTGAPLYSCAGMLTTTGTIAQYANVTHGWDLDSDNVAHLTYYFGSLTPKVPAATVENEIQRALSAWASHVNVQFSPSAISSATRSIYIEFASGAHGDSYPFQANGGMFAHTFYPVPINAETIAGDMHFNADEAWAVGNTGSKVDVYTVALHEIGHALGLSHSDNPDDVMYPYYHYGQTLSANDIGAVQQLYQVPAPVTQAPAQPPVVVTTTTSTTGTVATQPPEATALALTIDSVPATTTASILNVTAVVNGGAGPYTVLWQTNQGYTGTAQLSGSNMWTACDIPLAIGSNALTLTVFDANDHTASRSVTTVMQPPASAPPAPIKVSIASPASAVVNVTASTINVSGTASGGASITQIAWQTSNGATGVATGVSSFVAIGIPVLQGTNTIIIRAYDSKGASNWVALVAVHQ